MSSKRLSGMVKLFSRYGSLGLAGTLCAVVAVGQAPPQLLPQYHTVVAGNGSALTVQTVSGTVAAPLHGTEPGDGGPATAAALNGPDALAVDSLGNLYIVDGSGPVRKVDTSGNITTFAGGNGVGKNGNFLCPTGVDLNGDGCPANEAYLNSAHGIAIDPKTGDIYIAEATGNRIRRVDHSTYVISLVTGTGTKGNVNGPVATASVSGPRGLAIDRHGNLYVADTTNSMVRLVTSPASGTGTVSTVVNTSGVKATTATCTTTTTTAGAASTGSVQDVAFDNQGNLYVADATCNYVYKVSEDPATGMVDAGSTFTPFVGDGLSLPVQTVFTNVPAAQLTVTPASVKADPLGNLYIGESTGSHVYFYDAATKYAHAVFGGAATPGACYGQAGSGTPPYNGCDGFDSALAATKGTPGLALDAWGNLYVADPGAFYVHKLALGTNAPQPTVPAGYNNALLHFGAGDSFGSINMTKAPDFSINNQGCTTNAASDNTQDCALLVVNTNPSSSAQYEWAQVTSTLGLITTIGLTNQAYPTCQAPVVTNATAYVSGTSVSGTLSTPGDGCSGAENVVTSPHVYQGTVTTPPAHGNVTFNGSTWTYTPTGAAQADSFTYTVTDQNTFTGSTITYDNGASTIVLEKAAPQTSAPATVTIFPYTAPVATPQSVTVTYNTAQAVTLAGTDSNGATLTYAIATAPAHGSLSAVSGSSVTYTPATGYAGTDSFAFTVNDGVSTSAPATVSLTVLPAAPVAANQNVAVAYQTATTVTLSATGQGTITFSIATQPAHGTLGTLTGAAVTYTPAKGYSGADSFTFTATNAGGSSVGQVSITVGQPPPVPVAQNSSATVVYQTATPITAVAGGGDGQPLVYSVVSGPAHGTVSAFSGAVITYTPANGYSGADSFTFSATDGTGTSNTATISITVTPAPPVASGQNVTAAFQTATPVTLSATGAGTLTYAVVTQPAHGTLSGTAPALTYTPASNYTGTDSFTYTASNGATSNVATVTITVSAPPPPTVPAQNITVPFGTAQAVTLAATGSGTITYAVATQPAHGTLSGTAPNLTYLPNTGYTGPDSFTFTASNPGGSTTGTVSLTVAPVPPVAQSFSTTVANSTATPITLQASGTGTITYAVVTAPAHGTYTLSGAVLTYTPAAGYTGPDSFTYTASNGSVSNVATVSITVNVPVPVAASENASTGFNTPVTVTLSATGTGPFTYAIASQPSHGTLGAVNGATVTYTPTSGFTGSDTFTYTAANAGGAGGVATVTIKVNAGLIITAGTGGTTVTVKQGSTATYNLQLSGPTGDNDPVSFTCTGAAIVCTVSPNPVTLNGTTPVSVTVSMVTTVSGATSAAVGFTGGRPWMAVLLTLAGAALAFAFRRRKPVLLMVLGLVATAGFAGCGMPPEHPFGTTPGTYTMTVTATDTASAATPAPTGSLTLTLIVN